MIRLRVQVSGAENSLHRLTTYILPVRGLSQSSTCHSAFSH